ncbi:hypothetical protein FDG2_6527 [Candidatus Protofrankia californiensis]|uniref:Uncharacterized protein n=1 Tax=Candidatus Protofrankia californiensis TaxID=1839754 RepID=A0A1C3PH55_9ACTN|nr:hypothetical protein FDG2_6527 [Candidatus Protofrankia californiensis]
MVGSQGVPTAGESVLAEFAGGLVVAQGTQQDAEVVR